jgi:hypothetical protein
LPPTAYRRLGGTRGEKSGLGERWYFWKLGGLPTPPASEDPVRWQNEEFTQVGNILIMITDFPKIRISRRKDRFFQILGSAPKYLYQLPVFLFFVLIILGEINEILVWTIILIVVIVISGIVFSERKIWQKKWSAFAKETGLEFQLYKSEKFQIYRWPRISGIYQGRQMKMERYLFGIGRREEIFTTIICNLKMVAKEIMIITPKSWHMSSQMNDHHYSELELTRPGDKKLDNLFRIKSSNDQYVGELLSSQSLKKGLQELITQAPDMEIVIQGRDLYYRERSNIMDKEYFVALSAFLGEIANCVERNEYVH